MPLEGIPIHDSCVTRHSSGRNPQARLAGRTIGVVNDGGNRPLLSQVPDPRQATPSTRIPVDLKTDSVEDAASCVRRWRRNG